MSGMMVLGKRIRTTREARGLSREELARRVGLTLGQVGNIEKGKSAPSFDRLAKLADALGVEVREFFDFEWGRARKTDETG